MYDQDYTPEFGSFTAFYARYRPLVFGVALRVVCNPFEAEDVVQTTFLKAWRNPASFRGGNVESWLTILAKHAAVDLIRKRKRESHVIPIETLPDARSDNDVAEEVLLALQCRWVAAQVQRLPPKRRALLRAAYWEGCSHAQIALACGLPLGTIKTHIRSSIAQLRKNVAH